MSIFILWSFWLFVLFMFFFFFGLWFIISGSGIMLEYVVCLVGGDISFMLIFDWVSMLFLSFVCFISSCVMYYSLEYMGEDKYKERFCLLVVLFVMSMGLLILSPSFFSILLGWDGLGLVSYCLVVYYYNVSSYNAGMITIMMNRIGDVSILIGIVFFVNYGGWDLYSWNLGGGAEVIYVCVLLAAMTKSAQIPFSAWLPAAMAAPTPVSSLVHSSTLVTAGVYLLIRFNSLFYCEKMLTDFLMVISCLTLVMSGMGANFEYDLKSIVALSTLSQLGMMMFSLSCGGWRFAYFHMLTHAVFKSLLFLCSGSIIHGVGGGQDIRYLGGLIYMSPLISVSLSVSSLSLMGFPFLSGFYSKDLIIECFGMGSLNVYMYMMIILSVGMTSCYSLRMSYYVMWGDNSFNGMNMFGDYEIMSKPIVLLSLFSVFVGSMLGWLMFDTPVVVYMDFWMKLITVFMMLLGGIIGLIIWGFKVNYVMVKGGIFYDFMGGMWFLSWLSGNPNLLVYELGNYYLESDLTWGEVLGGQGVYYLFFCGSVVAQWFQDNSLKLMLFTFFIWLIFLLI